MYDTILLSIDGSKSAGRATDHATTLASTFDADLHAIYVVDTKRYSDLPIEDDDEDDVLEELEEQGQQALQNVVDQANVEVTTEIRRGRPSDEIDAYADEIDADVVVLGHRGRGSPAEPLIGSVAERVVRTATRPIILA